MIPLPLPTGTGTEEKEEELGIWCLMSDVYDVSRLCYTRKLFQLKADLGRPPTSGTTDMTARSAELEEEEEEECSHSIVFTTRPTIALLLVNLVNCMHLGGHEHSPPG